MGARRCNNYRIDEIIKIETVDLCFSKRIAVIIVIAVQIITDHTVNSQEPYISRVIKSICNKTYMTSYRSHLIIETHCNIIKPGTGIFFKDHTSELIH